LRQTRNILLIGATSAIAKEVARLYAAQGAALFLVARNEKHLNNLQADLQVRGAEKSSCLVEDLNVFDRHAQIIKAAAGFLGTIDVALICHGSLPDQQACEQDFTLTEKEIHTNALSVISLLTVLAQHFISQGKGTIAAITSVAGDRGRQSNYVYGAAKAMVSIYLQGLRGRLLSAGIHVVDIRPGFVDSPMTAQFKKNALWASPAKVARVIVHGIAGKRHTVYAPHFWRLIMFAVHLVPEFIFKRIRI
jgi:decaprenylphospho-beta-D-erythro-pentofuranosid-2-ulose 2-reductase